MQKSAFRLVITVADKQAGRVIACVERHAVGSIELLQSIALLAEMHQIFAAFVEFEDMVAGVTVRQEDVAVGCNGDSGGAETFEVEA